jgi:manganese/zinc/iron transport system permease protein
MAFDAGAFLAAAGFAGGWNTAVVTGGAAMLGAAAGAAGCFAHLRRRALAADAFSHATLPGVALAFLLMAGTGGDGRWLPGLLLGAAGAALLGMAALEAMVRRTRLTEDAATAAVLSTFFGAGVVLLTLIQTLPLPGQAGLDGFLLGQTAGMLAAEAWTIAGLGALAIAVIALLRRPMTLVCFDAGHAATLGVPVRLIDAAILGVALVVMIAGLKIVGLVLIVALLITPPVAARFWTDRVGVMLAVAAAQGAAAGWLGAALSAAAPQAPTGALIVLVAFALFAASLLFAPRRGVLAQAAARARLSRP